MADAGLMKVLPEDEQRHEAGAEPLWGESYYLDFVDDEGEIGGYLRIGYYPNLGVEWWTASIVEAGIQSVMSVSYDAPMTPLPALESVGPGYEATMEVTVPLQQMRVAVTASAESFADPRDIYRGGAGAPTTMGMDLAWSTDGVPYHYEVTTRYEIPCRVAGEILIGDRRITIQGQGQRDHSWGVRDWWAQGWCWSAARLEDGTRIHATDVRFESMNVALGYLQPGDGTLEVVTVAQVTEDLGDEGLPTKGRAVLNDGAIDVTIEPLGFGPLLLTSAEGAVSRFPRAMARFTELSGRSGLGWVEWNQPQ